MHALDIKPGQSGLLRCQLAMDGLPQVQTLVCLDVIFKIPGIASGTYLYLATLTKSSHHQHRHHYKALEIPLRTDGLTS